MADACLPGSQVKEVAASPHLISAGQVVWATPICRLTITIFWTVTPFTLSCPVLAVYRATVRDPCVADLFLRLLKVAGAGELVRRGKGAELGMVGPAHCGEAGKGQPGIPA